MWLWLCCLRRTQCTRYTVSAEILVSLVAPGVEMASVNRECAQRWFLHIRWKVAVVGEELKIWERQDSLRGAV